MQTGKEKEKESEQKKRTRMEMGKGKGRERGSYLKKTAFLIRFQKLLLIIIIFVVLMQASLKVEPLKLRKHQHFNKTFD